MFDTYYTDKIEYMTFFEAMIEEQREMEDYVNECITLSGSNNNKVFNEFQVFNEGKFGDKVKGLFNRLKSVFSRIWQKFLEKLNAWSQDNKKYLETYKDIILGKKITLTSVKMKNHFEGRERITKVFNNVSKFAIPIKFDNFIEVDGAVGNSGTEIKDGEANNVDHITTQAKKSIGTDNEDIKNNLYTEYLVSQYKDVIKQAEISGVTVNNEDDLDGISSALTNYFNGDEEDNTYSTSDIQEKIKVIFNEVYTYKESFEGLNKIQETYKAGMDKTEKAYDAAFSKMSSLIKARAQHDDKPDSEEYKKADQAVKTQDTDVVNALNKAKADAKTESYSYLNEIDIQSGNSDPSNNDGNKSSSTNKAGGTTMDTSSSVKKSDSIQKDMNAKNTNIKKDVAQNDVNNKSAAVHATKTAQQIDYKKLDEFQNTAMSLIRAFSTTRTTVFGAMLNGLTSMRNDYMTIIRAHVNSYLGKINDTGSNTDYTTSNPNTSK